MEAAGLAAIGRLSVLTVDWPDDGLGDESGLDQSHRSL